MFKKRGQYTTSPFGLVIDIGSGSVGAAIVFANPESEQSDILWSHREYVTMKESIQLTDIRREVETAFFNTALQIGTEGLATLYSKHNTRDIFDIKINVSAPWAYTVSRSVNFTDSEPFTIDEELLSQLRQQAEEESKAKFSEIGLDKLDLSVVAHNTSNTKLNGYSMEMILGKATTDISITHITTLMPQKMVNTITEHLTPIAPRAKIKYNSTIQSLHKILTLNTKQTKNCCIIDITYEATEFSIIKDSAIVHVTHIPYGTRTIAREISAAFGIPKEEAISYLQDNNIKPGPEVQTTISEITAAYEQKLAAMIENVMRNENIPSHFFVHATSHTEQFWTKHIAASAASAETAVGNITAITDKFFPKDSNTDSGLLVAASTWYASR